MVQPNAKLPSDATPSDPVAAEAQESHGPRAASAEADSTSLESSSPDSASGDFATRESRTFDATAPDPASSTTPSNSATSAPISPAPLETQGKGRRNLSLLLVAALLLCGVALVVQTERVAKLGSEVTALGIALAESEAKIAAYESRLVHVRSELADVLLKVGLLHEFVSEDPGEAVGQGLESEPGSSVPLPGSPDASTPATGTTSLD